MYDQAPDGGIDYDQVLGSILERWLTTSIPSKCRFCRKDISKDLEPKDQYCSEECKEKWKTVMRARLVIGTRDLELRGFD